jgi:hypothetical protein
MTTSVKYSDSRFIQLSEKISRLQNYELKNSDQHTNIESKMDKIEIEYKRVLKDYESRYNFIYDEIQLVTKIINNNRETRERLKNKYQNEFTNLEAKVKEIFENERKFITTSINNLFKNIENEIEHLSIFFKRENDTIQTNIKQILLFLDKELPRFNSEIEQLTEDNRKKADFVTNSMKEELEYISDKVNIANIA